MKLGLGKKIGIAYLAILSPFLTSAQDELPLLELDLEKAIEIALNENPSVKVADLEIQKKQFAKKSAQSALYPQIDVVGQYSRAVKKQVMYMDSGGDSEGGMASMFGDIFTPIIGGTEMTFSQLNPDYTLGSLADNIQYVTDNMPSTETDGDGGITVGRDNTWTGGFNLNWPVVVPTLWKSLELSSLDVELAVESARASKINMINSIRKSYYGVLFAKDALSVLRTSYDNAMMNYKDIKNKFEQGIVSEFDMIRADVNAKNIKPNLVQAENAYNLATLSLKALMGIDMDMKISVSGSLKDYEENLYAELLNIDPALDSNSDLIQFDIQNNQLKKTLEVYKAQYLPTVAITGNYMYLSMNNDFKFGDYRWNPYSTVGLSVSIPLFDGFKKRNDIKQTKVSLEQLQWQRQDIVRNLELAVKNNVNNMTNYVEQVISTKDVVVQAEKGYEISQKLYDTGMGTLLDLNDAQLGLTQASLAFNQAIYNFLAAKADLDKTLGIDPETIIENNK